MDAAAIIANTLNGLFSVLGVLTGLVLMNRIDRRKLLLAGFTLTTTFHLLVGLSALLLPDGNREGLLHPRLRRALRVLDAGHDRPAGVADPLGDLPLKIRSFAIGVRILVLWLANALVSLAFPPVVEGIGIASTFFIFVVLGLLALWFVYKAVPETRGRSLEQLEQQFRERYS